MGRRSKTCIITFEKQRTSKKISETNLNLIKERIHQLDAFNQEEDMKTINRKAQQPKPTKQQIKNIELIPFIMMYIFLNYECIYSNSGSKPRNFLEKAKEESILKTSIL